MEMLKAAVDDLNKRTPELLEVLLWPDERLSLVSKIVTEAIPTNKHLQDLLQDMEYTMLKHGAVGIAAIQVGVPYRVLIVRGTKTDIVKVINPVIISEEGTDFSNEGCLSFPGVFTRVKRAAKVVISYFDEKGESKITEADGLLGRAILHEMDHLDGKTFLDKVDFIKKSAMIKKVKKVKKILSKHA